VYETKLLKKIFERKLKGLRNNGAYLLTARTVKPGETAVTKERLCKHAHFKATDSRQATTESLGNGVLYAVRPIAT
jgi:hypothetical protein